MLFRSEASNCSVGIKENSTSTFQLYPNPAQNELLLYGLNGSTITEIEISNILAEVVGRSNYSNKTEVRVDLGDLPSGIYFIHINRQTTLKVVHSN